MEPLMPLKNLLFYQVCTTYTYTQTYEVEPESQCPFVYTDISGLDLQLEAYGRSPPISSVSFPPAASESSPASGNRTVPQKQRGGRGESLTDRTTARPSPQSC